MKRRLKGLTAGALLLAWSTASAQIAPQARQKQVDIGAADAPLSDLERADLDKAVKTHNYAAEKAVIDKAVGEHPNSYELLVMAGRLAYLEKQPKNAAAALQAADKLKPLAEQDRMTLAIAYEFAGQPNESRTEILKLTKLAPQNAEYWYLLGRVDRKNSRLEDAAMDLNKSIQLDPKFLRAYQDLGQTQQDLGKPADARKNYETAAAINRQQANPWEWPPLDLATLEFQQNNLSGAEKLIQEAIKYKPRFAWAHYYMGQVFEKQNRDSDATQEYKEAVVDDPRLSKAWLALSSEFRKQGNKTEADRTMTVYQKLIAQQTPRSEKN